MPSSGPPSLTLAHVQGFGAGITAGLLLGVIGFAWLTNQSTTAVTNAVEESQVEDVENAKPRFDFYTVLPSQTLDLTSDVEPPDLNSGNSDLYVLQAGSLRRWYSDSFP